MTVGSSGNERDTDLVRRLVLHENLVENEEPVGPFVGLAVLGVAEGKYRM